MAGDVEDEEPDADTARADALAARVLGTLNPDGSVVWDRATSVVFEGHLVIDFLTLTRERDRVALLDGQPLPPQIAREYAAGITAWRRFVTDPATDHLIDVGARYTDQTLHRFILARDICRNPVHEHIPTSTRLQMDHAEEAPHGPTSADNCGGICIPSHQLKTARRVDITDSGADGSCTWTTRAGQVVHIPPRPFLDHPDPPLFPRRSHGPPPAPDPADDIPPFSILCTAVSRTPTEESGPQPCAQPEKVRARPTAELAFIPQVPGSADGPRPGARGVGRRGGHVRSRGRSRAARPRHP